MNAQTLLPCSLAIAAGLFSGTAQAQDAAPTAPAEASTQTAHGMLTLDYQVIKVPDDKPIDLLGFHVYTPVNDRLYLGVGAYAPHVKGAYGGFMAFDVGAHYRHPLGGPWWVTAELSGGGGGGGRSVGQSKVLSGTGGFVKGSLGLAYDLGPATIGAGLTRMKFRHSLIDSTQAHVFVNIPYSYLSSTFRRDGEPLSEAEDRQARQASGENMLGFSFDNIRQHKPQGSNKGVIRTADLQFSHFFAPDSYWYGALGVGYAGLPIYNQMIGGVGQRMRLSQDLNLYAQLGMGSGGYAPSVIDTGPGWLVYPKLSLEYTLTRNLGLMLSAGYLTAPKGTSRNTTYALALTHHLGSSRPADSDPPASWRGFRVSTFQQTEYQVRFAGVDRGALHMIGVQVDKPLGGAWYLPLQAAVAYNDYLSYPGYGELLAGIGLQTAVNPGDRLQFFGQLMGGANVHGVGVKLSGGVRYLFSERVSMHLTAGRFAARDSSDRRYSANTVGVGVDYRFAIPAR